MSTVKYCFAQWDHTVGCGVKANKWPWSQPATSDVPAYGHPFVFIMIYVAIPLIIHLLRMKFSDKLPTLLLVFGSLVFQSTMYVQLKTAT